MHAIVIQENAYVIMLNEKIVYYHCYSYVKMCVKKDNLRRGMEMNCVK